MEIIAWSPGRLLIIIHIYATYILLAFVFFRQPCYYTRQFHIASMKLSYPVLNIYLIISWFFSLPFITFVLSHLWNSCSDRITSCNSPIHLFPLTFLRTFIDSKLKAFYLYFVFYLGYFAISVTFLPVYLILMPVVLCSSFVDNLQTNHCKHLLPLLPFLNCLVLLKKKITVLC